MNCKWGRVLLVLGALGMGAVTAAATPIVWTLSGVTFSTGGTASGSFTYDATTNIYSSISISTTGGTLPAITYTSNIALLSSASALDVSSGLRTWLLAFASALTNAGGTVNLTNASVEASVTPFAVRIASGSVTATPTSSTPEPTTLSLMSLGGLLMLFARLRFGNGRNGAPPEPR